MAGINSVLITGTNRSQGIGLELVRQFVTREPSPNFIFATCRDPSKAQALQELAKQHASIHIIALEVGNEETYRTAFEEVEKHVGDSGLDMLINNAAINDKLSIGQVTSDGMMECFNINAVGPMMIAKTFLPLIRKSASRRERRGKQAIINVSSEVSSMSTPLIPGVVLPYRVSKAALNCISLQLAEVLRPEGIIAISLCPGWARTDMGGPSAKLSPEQSVSGIFRNVFSKLTMENSGKFFSHTGRQIGW